MSIATPTVTAITSATEAKAATRQIGLLQKRAKAFRGLGLPDDADAIEAEADAIDDRLQQYEAAQTRQQGAAAFDEMRAIEREARQLEEQWLTGLIALVGIAADLRAAAKRFHELRPTAYRGGCGVEALVAPREPIGLNGDAFLHRDPALAIGLKWDLPEARAELAKQRTPPKPNGSPVGPMALLAAERGEWRKRFDQPDPPGPRRA